MFSYSYKDYDLAAVDKNLSVCCDDKAAQEDNCARKLSSNSLCSFDLGVINNPTVLRHLCPMTSVRKPASQRLTGRGEQQIEKTTQELSQHLDSVHNSLSFPVKEKTLHTG